MFLVLLNLLSRSSTPIQNIGYELEVYDSLSNGTITDSVSQQLEPICYTLQNTVRVEKVQQQNKLMG